MIKMYSNVAKNLITIAIYKSVLKSLRLSQRIIKNCKCNECGERNTGRSAKSDDDFSILETPLKTISNQSNCSRGKIVPVVRSF